MFTSQTYQDYFKHLEEVFQKAVRISTGLHSELSDHSLRNKLYAILGEDMDAFLFAREQQTKF